MCASFGQEERLNKTHLPPFLLHPILFCGMMVFRVNMEYQIVSLSVFSKADNVIERSYR